MRILVVDDDPNILELVSIQLGQAGYTVQKASNGFQALELLEIRHFLKRCGRICYLMR